MKTITLQEFANMPNDEEDWLIDHFLPLPSRILLIGPPKEGKSYFAIQTGLAVAKGERFLARPSKASKVLYLQYDEPTKGWRNRINKLMNAGVELDDNFVVLHPDESRPSLDLLKSPSDVLYLQEIMDKVQPKLVIVDSLRKIFTGDENSSDTMAQVFKVINEVFKKCAVILIHHTHKLSPPPGQKIQHRIKPADAARGSSAISAEVDAIYLLLGKRLSTDCRFDESTDYNMDKDPITHLWTYPDEARMLRLEHNIIDQFRSRVWPSWLAFHRHCVAANVGVPDHLMARLELQLSGDSAVRLPDTPPTHTAT